MKNKKAAIELSIGTVVIIVIAMSMLILGLVLVRSIFSGATESVNTLNDKVRAEITSIFAEEDSKISIRLGSDKLAKVKQGTSGFGIAFGGRTSDGSTISETNILQYKLAQTNADNIDCQGITILNNQFNGRITSAYDFEETDGDVGRTILIFNIDDSAPECTQRYQITIFDNSGNQLAQSSFYLQIETGGVFSK